MGVPIDDVGNGARLGISVVIHVSFDRKPAAADFGERFASGRSHGAGQLRVGSYEGSWFGEVKTNHWRNKKPPSYDNQKAAAGISSVGLDSQRARGNQRLKQTGLVFLALSGHCRLAGDTNKVPLVALQVHI